MERKAENQYTALQRDCAQFKKEQLLLNVQLAIDC